VRRPFVVLWLATLFFFLGFQMLLPVMPLYAAWLGAREADVGFITLYTAWELGIFGGSVLLGFCATRLGYEATWWTAAAIAGIGAIAALCPGSRLRR
jgi:predicted MFS family arabinose efflux permease